MAQALAIHETVKTLISVDVTKTPDQQPTPLFNRLHPEVPPVIAVNPGEAFRVECIDWTGGQIHNNDSANDVRDVDLTQVHYMSGPIAVNGAEPGDLLVVEILDVGPLQTSEWGFTGIFSRDNGGGFLTDHFPDAKKAIWDFKGIYATSRHVPGVKFVGINHPGLMATAPDQSLLDNWNRRETDLVNSNPNRVPPLGLLPEPKGALMGQLKGSQAERVAREGARTVPPREDGGNVDIKNLTKGSKAYFPVYVKGANLSMGDIHFSQGDGEITFCGAIEMAGYLDLHVELIKDGINKFGITNPIFLSSPLEPHYSEYLVFEGISVDEQDKQYYLDAHIAYKRACLNAINYLSKFGYAEQQAYVILGTAPVEGRISGIVDIPNACCTLYIPTEIFEFDVKPSGEGPKVVSRGQLAQAS